MIPVVCSFQKVIRFFFLNHGSYCVSQLKTENADSGEKASPCLRSGTPDVRGSDAKGGKCGGSKAQGSHSLKTNYD